MTTPTLSRHFRTLPKENSSSTKRQCLDHSREVINLLDDDDDDSTVAVVIPTAEITVQPSLEEEDLARRDNDRKNIQPSVKRSDAVGLLQKESSNTEEYDKPNDHFMEKSARSLWMVAPSLTISSSNHNKNSNNNDDEDGDVIVLTGTSDRVASGLSRRQNPFAEFALGSISSTSSTAATKSIFSLGHSPIGSITPLRVQRVTVNSRDQSHNSNSESDNQTMKTKENKKLYPRMLEHTHSEREAILNKWFSIIGPCEDHRTEIMEQRRFHMLVAARLHARCQDGPVHKAMKVLKQRMHPFTVSYVAESDPFELEECIRNLQYYSVKAKQIVRAAQVIMSRFGGIVPHEESALTQLPGIGPVLADLLAFINTDEHHLLFSSSSATVKETTTK